LASWSHPLAHETEPSSSSQNSREPRGLLYILASVFSGVLFGLFFSQLRTPLQDSHEFIQPQENTGTEANNPYEERLQGGPSTKPRVPEADAEKKKAYSGCANFFRWGNLIVQILIFVAASFYGGVSYFQWQSQQRATKIDERAWMGFSLPSGLQIQKDAITKQAQALLIPIQIINTGKTVAKNVSGDVVITVIDKGEKLTFNMSDYSHYGLQGGAIFPNGQMGLTQPAIKRGQDGIAKTIIPTDDLLQRIDTAKSFAVVFGHVTYCDVFGVPHKTTFCRYVTVPGLIDADCMNYNDADDNEKPDKQRCPVTEPRK
jgi:hypothetical protein